MQRATAAERHRNKVFGIVSALHRDQPDSTGHFCVGNADHGLGRCHGFQAQRFANFPLNRQPGRFNIKSGLSASNGLLGIDAAEDKIGIGHGRMNVALCIADGSGIRPGAFRPDLEQSARIDPCDRTTPRANRADLDHRRPDDHAKVDLGLRHHLAAAFRDHRHIKTGPTHIAGNEVLDSHGTGDMGTCNNTGRRTGQCRPDGKPAGRVDCHHTAIGLYDQDVPVQPVPTQPPLETLEIFPYDGLQVGVQRRRRGPLKFPDFRQDLICSSHVWIGPYCPHCLHGPTFVVIIGVGIDEENTDRLGSLVKQLLCGPGDLARLDRSQHGSVRKHPFVDFQTEIPGNQGNECPPQTPCVGPVPTPHFQHIPKPACGDQTSPGALAFEQRVGRYRRPMDDCCHPTEPTKDPRDSLLNTA